MTSAEVIDEKVVDFTRGRFYLNGLMACASCHGITGYLLNISVSIETGRVIAKIGRVITIMM